MVRDREPKYDAGEMHAQRGELLPTAARSRTAVVALPPGLENGGPLCVTCIT